MLRLEKIIRELMQRLVESFAIMGIILPSPTFYEVCLDLRRQNAL